MNKGELRTRIRRQTLIDSTELSDAEIDQDMEQGILDVASRARWPFLYATDTISLLAATAEYNLPADFMFLEELTHDAEGHAPLERTTQAAVKAIYGDDVGDSDLPNLWYPTTDQKIIFVPTPSAAKTVNITYYKTPDLTLFDEDTEEPPWHSSFHLILADVASAFIWEREEQEEKAGFYWGRYFNGIERMAQFYENRLPAEPLIVGGGTARRRYVRTPAWWTE